MVIVDNFFNLMPYMPYIALFTSEATIRKFMIFSIVGRKQHIKVGDVMIISG